MTSIELVENSDEKPTVRELRRAAHVANRLDEFLDRCQRTKAMPLLIGYDLDHLSRQFTEAADALAEAQR